MIGFLYQYYGLVTLAWVLVYISDYYLTILGAKLYRQGAKDHISYSGSYELTPVFQKDIDALNVFSRPFIIRVLLSAVIIPLIWWLAVGFFDLYQFYAFAIGGLFLREAVVHLRHLRNVSLFYLVARGGGIEGQVVYARWLNLRLSAVELAGFALLFLGISLAMSSWGFLGGAVFCSVTGIQHWIYSRKARAAVQTA